MRARHYPSRRGCSETGLSFRVVNDLPLCAPAVCGSFPYQHVHAGIYSSFQSLPAVPAQVGFPTQQCAQPPLRVNPRLALAPPVSPGILPYRNISPLVGSIKNRVVSEFYCHYSIKFESISVKFLGDARIPRQGKVPTRATQASPPCSTPLPPLHAVF